MREFTKEEIINYADKLLIGLTEEEAKTTLEEFAVIDKKIDQINQIEGLEKVTPVFSPFDLYSAQLREDEAKESTLITDALANCEEVIDREIKVPKVVN